MDRRAPVAAMLVVGVALLPAACNNRALPGADAAAGVAPRGPTVDTTDTRSSSATRVEELMEGRFPGVRVIRLPGGGFAVRVWGPGVQTGDSDPLYVVDGMPINVAPGRGLDWLNPGDIATIRVLKNISETAPYGVRGAAGVVLITTKHGHRDGG